MILTVCDVSSCSHSSTCCLLLCLSFNHCLIFYVLGHMHHAGNILKERSRWLLLLWDIDPCYGMWQVSLHEVRRQLCNIHWWAYYAMHSDLIEILSSSWPFKTVCFSSVLEDNSSSDPDWQHQSSKVSPHPWPSCLSINLFCILHPVLFNPFSLHVRWLCTLCTVKVQLFSAIKHLLWKLGLIPYEAWFARNPKQTRNLRYLWYKGLCQQVTSSTC